jgi:hypothetical protein
MHNKLEARCGLFHLNQWFKSWFLMIFFKIYIFHNKFITIPTNASFIYREDPLPLRCEWDNRGRRVSMKGRQRMLSGPDSSSSHNDRYSERMRDRSSWSRPYRIPRPKLLNMGHCSRIRTISALLHEESDVRLPTIRDTSPVANTAEPRLRDMSDALRCMAIGEGLTKTIVSLLFI